MSDKTGVVKNKTGENSTRVQSQDPRWHAVVSCDAKADGRFVYAVKTTGIYCAPSCPSRQPNPENILYFDDAEAAEQAGFRPCKRCRQGLISLAQFHAQRVAQACRLLEQSADMLTLNQLAAGVGISAYHFHRLFKAQTGLTPKEYQQAQRARRVRENLTHSATVTEAIHAAGYPSDGRFYETSAATLGMTPQNFRSGGRDVRVWFAIGKSSLGDILVAESQRGICAILLGDDPEKLINELQNSFPQAELLGGDPDFERRIASVIGFVEAPHLGLDLPL
ncbi:helix-turn-helix domain-containing protein, partial [Rahnella perminowiae]|uniref:bifunctional transcriptional activator/DNA repair enzyme AdaA n=1 Tax=Rahnella perminowiae TaxID=2816244 RepID=UPI00224B9756